MQTVIDKRGIQTAADLLRLIEEVRALGYDLETMHIRFPDEADVNDVALVQERLTDRSLVWNLKLFP